MLTCLWPRRSPRQMHQAMAHELLRLRDQKAAIANYRLALAADPNLPGAEL